MENDREGQTLKGLLAILAVALIIKIIILASLITYQYPVEVEEKETPIVYDQAPKDTIVYVQDTCPVCGKEAIASNDYLICNNPDCEMKGIPVEK